MQGFYDSCKICKNFVNILQEKDHFPNKYARFVQDSYKIRFARNLQSLARHFLLGTTTTTTTATTTATTTTTTTATTTASTTTTTVYPIVKTVLGRYFN